MTNIVVTTLSAGQSSKEATISQMVAELDAGVTDFLSLDATSGNVSVSSSNLKSHSKFRVFGHTVARTLTFSTPVKRGVIVENAGTAALSVIVGSTTLSLAAASAMLYYLDGTTNGLAVSVTAGPTTFAGLTDVNVPSPVDKSALIYDSASGKWIAALWSVTAQAGTAYTFVLADAGSTVESTSASATAFTIPANATVAFNVGTEIECIQQGAGLLTISPAAGVTLNGTALATTAQYQRVKLRKIATNTWNCSVAGSGSGGGATASTGLTDMPATLTAYKGLRVNSAGTAYEQIDLPYDVMVYAEGLLTASEVVYQLVATRAFRIPSGASGSAGKAGVAATASTTVNLTKNGTGFGTMVWAASGTAATVTVSADTDFAVGDTLTINAPATADVSLANVTFALAGIRR